MHAVDSSMQPTEQNRTATPQSSVWQRLQQFRPLPIDVTMLSHLAIKAVNPRGYANTCTRNLTKQLRDLACV